MDNPITSRLRLILSWPVVLWTLAVFLTGLGQGGLMAEVARDADGWRMLREPDALVWRHLVELGVGFVGMVVVGSVVGIRRERATPR